MQQSTLTEALKDKVIGFFEGKGWRWTVQRQLVLEALVNNPGHMSIDEILQQIAPQFPGFTQSTIYRTLELLGEAGVVVELVSADNNPRRYELVLDTPHYHLLCQGCGTQIELAGTIVQQLEADTLIRYGFVLDIPHIAGRGWCSKCQPNG